MPRLGEISITPLMRVVMEVLLKRIGEPLEAHVIASDIRNNPAYPHIGPANIVTPLLKLRKLRLVKKTRIQEGVKRFGPNEYPIFKKLYTLLPDQAALWTLLVEDVDRNGGNLLLETQFRDAKKRLSALSVTKQNEVMTNMESLPTDPKQPTTKYVPHTEPFFSFSTIRSRDDNSKYMTRLCIGRLRLHIMWRGDDDDCHDHPWDFWTFPLTSYVEEILIPTGGEVHYVEDGTVRTYNPTFKRLQNIVPAGRLTFRPAEHRHRILGRYSGELVLPGHEDDARLDYSSFKASATKAAPMLARGWTAKHEQRPIVTIVWRSPYKRQWGFWKNRAGRWCWMQYRKFIDGGKHAPCE